ncbi:hypothetical protein O6H91_01G087600 [Diphasiastrum complanatum]|uniref:Uncharacterized protein n=1 Tax=Diphasiastrum complanatum TaxID=34168 RepID=A0ACC2ET62_DIPCM|nr:hypothetical protein O6H91_01G087600 [Diphasiastrum complanatum]
MEQQQQQRRRELGGEGDGVPHNERLQMERIRELDLEQLEEEEVSSDAESLGSDEASSDERGDGGAGSRGGFTFDTSLTCRHTYLGEVDDIGGGRSFSEGGTFLTLPMFYLEGIVLFPDATLPLRVLQPRFKAAVERAIRQHEAPYTIGVIHVRYILQETGIHIASVGTTAEIRQLRHLNDGSINVLTRGRQRFRIRQAWTDGDGAPCAKVQIIPEENPLHIPRDAFGLLAAVPSLKTGKVPRAVPKSSDANDAGDDRYFQLGSDIDDMEEDDTITDHVEVNVHGADLQLGSEDVEPLLWWRRQQRFPGRGERSETSGDWNENDQGESSGALNSILPVRKKARIDWGWGGACKAWASDESKWMFRAQRTAWPHWVYRMFDAYDLSRRAADMWRQMVELPSMDDLVKSPELLSFFIASKMPLPDAIRQELLEMDGVVHRLRREIQLLESMDQIRCKHCQAVIARRTDMLVMSTDGPISAFVNEHGYVHETLTLKQVRGLNVRGRPEIVNSWFPGYAWTMADCICDSHMGWHFTAVTKNMRPRAFWGVRRSQIASVQ